MEEHPDRPRLPRRYVLGALAVAPAALAGCAAGRAERAVPAEGEAAAAAEAPPRARGPSSGAVAAVRGFRLPADAEPAFVFRAAAARPGEPR